MNGNHRYEVRGTEALACRIERGGSRNLIDYDVARRSYEARLRLAQRQQRAQVPASQTKPTAKQQARNRELRLVDVVESEYTPNRTALESIGEMLYQVKSTVVKHPFWYQLHNGTLRGEYTGKTSYRQVFGTSTVCLALSMLIVFLGA